VFLEAGVFFPVGGGAVRSVRVISLDRRELVIVCACNSWGEKNPGPLGRDLNAFIRTLLEGEKNRCIHISLSCEVKGRARRLRAVIGRGEKGGM